MTAPPGPEAPGTAALPGGFRLVSLYTVDSTNAEALRLAQSGAPDRTLVWATEQTHGRGRRGRGWASPPGNLYCSVLLYPSQAPEALGQASFVVALALADAIVAKAPSVPVEIKWPNDLLVAGCKIAGILLEGNVCMASGQRCLVIGAGVNIASHPDFADGLQATSLAEQGVEATPRALLEAYAQAVDGWLGRWESGGFGPIRSAWVACATGIGAAIEVSLPGQVLSGTFEAIDDSGGLIVGTGEGPRTIRAGDVFLTGPGQEPED